MDEWIDVRTAAEILKVSDRQVNNYGHGDPPKLRTRRAGPRRTLYLREDVDALAEETGASSRPGRKTIPRAEMVPVHEVLTQVSQAQQQVGYLQGQLDLLKDQMAEQQKLLVAAEDTRRDLAVTQERLQAAQQQLQAERDHVTVLESRLAELQSPALLAEPEPRRPWWKRLSGSD